MDGVGTEDPAEGLTIGEHQIAIGAGVVLDVAGAALPLNHRVGWSVPPTSVRICNNGRYRGDIHSVDALGVGHRVIIRLGGAYISSFQSHSDWVEGSPCGVNIDPHSVRVWPRD